MVPYKELDSSKQCFTNEENNKVFLSKMPTSNGGSHNTFESMKVLLYFGKIFGFFPISGVFTASSTEFLTVRKWNFSGLYALFVIFTLTLHFCITAYAFIFGTLESSPLSIANAARSLHFTAMGLYVVIFLYQNSQALIACLYQWENMNCLFFKEDPNLPLIVNAFVAIMLCSGIGENAVSHANIFIEHENDRNKSIILTYWEVHYPEKVDLIPYSAFIATTMFFANKFCLYAWNFGDLLISVVAIGLYRKFKLQNEYMMDTVRNLKRKGKADRKIWQTFLQDHEKLKLHLKKLGNLFSPLVFASTYVNLYFIAMTLSNFFRTPELYDTKYEEYQVWRQVFFVWSFSQLLIRGFTTFIFCGRVHRYAHKFSQVLDECPMPLMCKEVERAEFKLRTETVGFHGLNLFTITNSFILSALHAIFTFEIVLLQSPK